MSHEEAMQARVTGALCSDLLDRGVLTRWEETFITDMARLVDKGWPLSPKQKTMLEEIVRQRL